MMRLQVGCVALCLALVACGSDDEPMDTCDFSLTVSAGVQPTYEFTGGVVTSIGVTRADALDTVVWGIFSNPPGEDRIDSPVVHGVLPAGAAESAGDEPTLSPAIDYHVVVTRATGARCSVLFTP